MVDYGRKGFLHWNGRKGFLVSLDHYLKYSIFVNANANVGYEYKIPATAQDVSSRGRKENHEDDSERHWWVEAGKGGVSGVRVPLTVPQWTTRIKTSLWGLSVNERYCSPWRGWGGLLIPREAETKALRISGYREARLRRQQSRLEQDVLCAEDQASHLIQQPA